MARIELSCNHKIQVEVTDGSQYMVLHRNADHLPMPRDNFNEMYLDEIATKKIAYSIQDPKTDNIIGFVMESYLYCHKNDKETMAKRLVQYLLETKADQQNENAQAESNATS